MSTEYIIYKINRQSEYFRVEKKIATYFNGEIFGSPLVVIAEVLTDSCLPEILDKLMQHKRIDQELFSIDVYKNNAIFESSYLLKNGNYERDNFKIQIPLQSLINIIRTWLLLEEFSIEQISLTRADNVISLNGGTLSASTIFERYVYPWEDNEEPSEYITYQREFQGNYTPITMDLDLIYPTNQSPLMHLSSILTSMTDFVAGLTDKLNLNHFEDVIIKSFVIKSDGNKINIIAMQALKSDGEVKSVSFYKGDLERFLHNWMLMSNQNIKQVTVSRKDSKISLGSNGIRCCQTLEMYEDWIAI